MTSVYSEDESDSNDANYGQLFQPYAYSKNELWRKSGLTDCKATIADYKKYFDLNIGLYVQEFSIGPNELDSIIRFINDHQSIYNLGLAWGGINGVALKGVKGDGFWNQRYVGRNWAVDAAPNQNMTLLSPEDHHIVQKAIQAGNCGQVSTINHVLEEEEHLATARICEGPNLFDYSTKGTFTPGPSYQF